MDDAGRLMIVYNLETAERSAVFLFGVKEIPERGRKYIGNVELLERRL